MSAFGVVGEGVGGWGWVVVGEGVTVLVSPIILSKHGPDLTAISANFNLILFCLRADYAHVS